MIFTDSEWYLRKKKKKKGIFQCQMSQMLATLQPLSSLFTFRKNWMACNCFCMLYQLMNYIGFLITSDFLIFWLFLKSLWFAVAFMGTDSYLISPLCNVQNTLKYCINSLTFCSVFSVYINCWKESKDLLLACYYRMKSSISAPVQWNTWFVLWTLA